MLCIIIDQYCLLSFLCQPNIPKFRGAYLNIVRTSGSGRLQYYCTCNSGIISNLLLSRAYFPHLFHIISAKAKKASASPSEVNTCGSDLTLGLTLAHAVLLPKYAPPKIRPPAPAPRNGRLARV